MGVGGGGRLKGGVCVYDALMADFCGCIAETSATL